MNLFDFIENAVLVGIFRIGDLIKLDFSLKNVTYCIHVQNALLRGVKSGELVMSSFDMYLPSKSYRKKLFKKFKWDVSGNNLFDEQLEEFKKYILNKQVKTISRSSLDLVLNFSSDVRIELLANTLEKDKEVYRIFKKDDLDSHYVVETK